LDAQRKAGLHEWTRYWAARAAVVAHDEDDFVVAPTGPLGTAANPALVTLDDLAGSPCLILLGEPGLGKTTRIRQCTSSSGAGGEAENLNLVVNLADFNDVTELRSYVDSEERIRAWEQGGQRLCLWLDSLD